MENELLELKTLIRNQCLEELSAALNHEKTTDPLRNHMKILSVMGAMAEFCKSAPFVEKMQSVTNIRSSEIETVVDQVMNEIAHELY